MEVITFPFVGDAALDRLGLPADDPRRHTVRLANPISAEAPSYTTTLLPGLLKTAARNLGRGAPGVSLFETGTVAFPADRGPAPIYGVDWRPTDDELTKLMEAIPLQPLHLAVVLAGERERGGWWGAGRDAGWSDAVGVVRRLAAELGVEIEVGSASLAPWHPGRCAEVRIGDVVLGHAGELHPKVCRAVGVPARSAAVEIDLDLLLSHAREVVPGPDFSTFPLAKEDVALLVDDAVTVAARRGRPARAAPGTCWSRSGSSTSTPASRSAAGRSRWPSPCASGRPTGPSPRRRPAPPATLRSRPPSRGAAPSSGETRRLPGGRQVVARCNKGEWSCVTGT